MSNPAALESEEQVVALLTAGLRNRGLVRVPGPLAFAHKGESVTLSIDRSVYRGFYVTVHDRGRPARQFRAHAGNYDWNSIANLIVEIAESRLERRAPVTSPAGVKANNQGLADQLAALTGAGLSSPMTIEPSSAAPGRVRVRVPELDLDPDSVMLLQTVVSRALRK
jgi:hypothetical protein